jgi:DnaK suppressor protein
MDKEKLEYFREILKERFEEILAEAEKTVSGMTTANENFPDPTDRASLESDRNFMLRIREILESVRLAATISGTKD